MNKIAGKNAPGVDCTGDKVFTKQEPKNEVDINTIMGRIKRTGVMPDAMLRAGVYGDFSQVGDFLESKLKVQKAEENFMKLSAKVRSRFENNPGLLLDFMSDEANVEEARELGLLPPEETNDPDPGPVPPEPGDEPVEAP